MVRLRRTAIAWPWLSVLLLGCSTPTLYSWGHYQERIYASYVAPGRMSLEAQMPPGFHADLGCLYAQLGKLDQARLELVTEKTEFPESAVLVDRLLASLNKP